MAEKETKKVASTKTATTKKTTTKTTAKKETTTKTTAAKKVAAPKTAEVKVEAKKAPAKAAESKKTLKVTLIRSTIAAKPNQVKTVKALGLNKINSSNVLVDNEAVRGMIFTVKHLVRVEEV